MRNLRDSLLIALQLRLRLQRLPREFLKLHIGLQRPCQLRLHLRLPLDGRLRCCSSSVTLGPRLIGRPTQPCKPLADFLRPPLLPFHDRQQILTHFGKATVNGRTSQFREGQPSQLEHRFRPARRQVGHLLVDPSGLIVNGSRLRLGRGECTLQRFEHHRAGRRHNPQTPWASRGREPRHSLTAVQRVPDHFT